MPVSADWLRLARLARMLSWLTLAGMGVEGGVAIAAAVIAGSVALRQLADRRRPQPRRDRPGPWFGLRARRPTVHPQGQPGRPLCQPGHAHPRPRQRDSGWRHQRLLSARPRRGHPAARRACGRGHLQPRHQPVRRQAARAGRGPPGPAAWRAPGHQRRHCRRRHRPPPVRRGRVLGRLRRHAHPSGNTGTCCWPPGSPTSPSPAHTRPGRACTRRSSRRPGHPPSRANEPKPAVGHTSARPPSCDHWLRSVT